MSTTKLKLALVAAEALISASEWCVDGTRYEKAILVHAKAARRSVARAIEEARR